MLLWTNQPRSCQRYSSQTAFLVFRRQTLRPRLSRLTRASPTAGLCFIVMAESVFTRRQHHHLLSREPTIFCHAELNRSSISINDVISVENNKAANGAFWNLVQLLLATITCKCASEGESRHAAGRPRRLYDSQGKPSSVPPLWDLLSVTTTAHWAVLHKKVPEPNGLATSTWATSSFDFQKYLLHLQQPFDAVCPSSLAERGKQGPLIKASCFELFSSASNYLNFSVLHSVCARFLFFFLRILHCTNITSWIGSSSGNEMLFFFKWALASLL